MGLGKTIICLKAIEYLKIKTLVVAPKRVAEQVWSDEANKWGINLKLSLIKGSPQNRDQAIHTPADVYIIGVNNITRKLRTLKYDMIILDELSLYKNSRTVRYRTLRFLTDKIHRVVGLTGTPAPNSYIDIWSQIFLLDRGVRLGRNKYSFLDKYFYKVHEYAPGIFKYQIKDKAETIIQNQLSTICLSMRSEDYLELPRLIEITQKVQLNTKLKKIYRKLVKEGVVIIKNKEEIIENAMDLAMKCMQFANGFIYNKDHKGWYIHKEKLFKLQELIECSTGNILVAYQFKEDLKRIKKEFKDAKELKKSEDFNAWNNGDIHIGLLHPKSGGHGLNLQSGGNTIIWYSPTYSLEDRLQFNARLYRQGQNNTVIIHTIVTSGTIEEKIMKILNTKDVRMDILLEALKLDKEE